MSDGSLIEWTDATWNPVRGCKQISPGCEHCYAKTFAERWVGIPGHPYEKGFEPREVPEKLEEPLRWKKPRKVFVNSMSDLFLGGVTEPFIRSVFETMNRAPWHLYQVLTKRTLRMKKVTLRLPRELVSQPHIWLGTSVEDRKHGVPRIAVLRDVPATVRFLSIEPLLEDLGELDLSGIHWVIVGGESGPRARPMEKAWVTSILRQCTQQGVPFFFKQWGGVQKGKRGRELNGRTWDDFPKIAHAALGSGSTPVPTALISSESASVVPTRQLVRRTAAAHTGLKNSGLFLCPDIGLTSVVLHPMPPKEAHATSPL